MATTRNMIAFGADRPPDRLDASSLAAQLPSDPILASPADGWAGIALRHYCHPPGHVAEVSHRDHVVVLHRSGGAQLEERLDGTVRRATTMPGSISLTPAGQTVSRRWDAPSEVLLIVIDRMLVDAATRDLGADPSRVHLVPRLAAPDRDLDQLSRLLLSNAASPRPGGELMINALARALAVHLVQHHSNMDIRRDVHGPTLPPRRIARALEYMRANLERSITVPELAHVAGLSPSHLTRAFRKALGQTPYAYLIGCRLEKACELLERTERSITQIAFACGFEQSQHFAATFRRRYGVAPSDWRRLSNARP